MHSADALQCIFCSAILPALAPVPTRAAAPVPVRRGPAAAGGDGGGAAAVCRAAAPFPRLLVLRRTWRSRSRCLSVMRRLPCPSSTWSCCRVVLPKDLESPEEGWRRDASCLRR